MGLRKFLFSSTFLLRFISIISSIGLVLPEELERNEDRIRELLLRRELLVSCFLKVVTLSDQWFCAEDIKLVALTVLVGTL